MHERMVVHMDLQPSNIIIDKKNERLKIIDFDQAIIKPRGGGTKSCDDDGLSIITFIIIIIIYYYYQHSIIITINIISLIIITIFMIPVIDNNISRTIDIETPYFSPEMVLDFEDITYSTDMWSFGCIIADWIFQRPSSSSSSSFFREDNSSPHLMSIIKVSNYNNRHDNDLD
jgi:serine/threonine protein kinase